MEPSQKPYKMYGKQHGDTITTDYSIPCQINFTGGPEKYKLHRVIVYQDSKFIYGLQLHHITNTHPHVVTFQSKYGMHAKNIFPSEFVLDSDEFVTEIEGKCGMWFDSIAFSTNKGHKHEFGGSGGNKFTHKAPEGYQLTIPQFGTGGHLHNISIAELPIWSDAPLYCAEIKLQKGEKIFFGGRTNLDTQLFNPLSLTGGQCGLPHRVTKIEAFCDSSIYDLTATYLFAGNETATTLHVTKGWAGPKSKLVKYELEQDEVIVQVDGGTNDFMHYLSFKTNKGRNLEFGSMEKAQSTFKWVADAGHHLSLFRPGIGGHLHSLEAMQMPIPASLED